MKYLSFQDIYTVGSTVIENNLYNHIHYPEMLSRYDSNFIAFKMMPTLEEFKVAEAYLRGYHLERKQHHTKFYFPENEELKDELLSYLGQQGYETGFLELYGIKPKNFPPISQQSIIDVQFVTEDNLDIYLDLQYSFDVAFGEEFAIQKRSLIEDQFKDPDIRQVIAFYQEVPVGLVDIIISHNTVEIDGLTVLTSFRNKGIGSSLQKFVMDSYPTKTVILVADGEDTPREMYRKQNYQYYGFTYESQKVFSDNLK